MGKQNFENFYRQIKSELLPKFGKITGKISLYGENFDPSKNYAGMILYAIDGEFEWKNTGGKASGQRGWSFYVVIQSTNNWPSEAYGRARQGYVHDYLIKNVLGREHGERDSQGRQKICCGGFGYRDGQLKFSSWWLNSSHQIGCDSDGTKYLSDAERVLIKYCFERYKEKGVHHIFEIPSYIDNQLSGYQCLQEVPPKEGCRM